MKKLVSLLMLVLLVASFVTGVLVSKSEAIPPDTVVCIDGKAWLCEWDYNNNGVLRQHCHWSGPC